MPGTVEAFMSLIEAGWDTEVARRPHGNHTTVVMHLDVKRSDRVVASGVRCSRSPTVDI